MRKEILSSRQGISMMILFISGSSLVLGSGQEAKNDIWIALLLGLATTFLIVFMHVRILKQFPGKNLYEIILSVFGKIIGRLLCCIFIFYTFYLAALVLVNFTMFISVIGLEFTPVEVVSFCVIVLVIIGVKMGVEVLGRWSEFFVRFLYPIILLIIPFMLSMVEANHLKPILAEGISPVLDGALSVITFPFAEIVIFTMIFGTKDVIRHHNIKKVFLWGLLLGGLLIVATDVTAYLTLGGFAFTSSYFPIYSAVSRINIKDILERVEIVIAVSFLLGGFIKISACVLACGNGLGSLFNLKDYRFLVTPLGLLIMIVSLTTYDSIMEMVAALPGFRYVAILAQIILPFCVLIALEIKLLIQKKKSSKAS